MDPLYLFEILAESVDLSSFRYLLPFCPDQPKRKLVPL